MIPALLLTALFGSEHALVGESRPGILYPDSVVSRVSFNDVRDSQLMRRKQVGSQEPTLANSQRLSISPGKAYVNDTDPGVGFCLGSLVGSFE